MDRGELSLRLFLWLNIVLREKKRDLVQYVLQLMQNSFLAFGSGTARTVFMLLKKM